MNNYIEIYSNKRLFILITVLELYNNHRNPSESIRLQQRIANEQMARMWNLATPTLNLDV